MQTRWWRAAAIFALSLAIPAATARPAQSKEPRIAVVGNFFDPASADDALFSPDGKVVMLPDYALDYATQLTLWDASSGLPLRSMRRPTFATASLFTPGGTTIMSGHKDGVINLWEVATGELIWTINRESGDEDEFTEQIMSLWTDPKGELLVAGNRSGRVGVWRLADHRKILSVRPPPLDNLGNRPHIVAAKLTADRNRLIVVARVYNKPDTIVTYDARSGTELSSFDLPLHVQLQERGYFGDDEATVEVTADCAAGELMLFSFSKRAMLASIYKPADCAKPKAGDEPKPVRIFSTPDSALVVVSRESEPDMLVWDMAAHKLDRKIHWPDQTGSPRIIGVSHDLKFAATAETGGVRIRALDSGATVKDLRNFRTRARNVMTRAEGLQILQQQETSDEQKSIDIRLRGIDALQPVSARLAQAGDLTVYAFAPGPKLALAASDKGEVVLLPLTGGGEPRKFSSLAFKDVSRAELSADAKRALILGEAAKDGSGSAGQIAVLLDTDSGKIEQTFTGVDKDDYITGLAMSPDGASFAIGHRNGTADIWDLKSVKRVKTLPVAKEDGDTRTLNFSPDGRSLVGGGMFDDSVFLWNIASGKVTRIYEMGPAVCGYRYATALALSHDGKTLAAGLGQRAVSSGDTGAERGNVVVWNARTGKRLFTLRSQRGAIYALTFSPDDRWIVPGSLDGTIEYWDRTDGRLVATAAGGADGNWLVLTEAGFYAGSAGSDAAIAVVRGNEAFPVSAAQQQLFRPDLVEQLLKGDPEGRYRAAARNLNLSAMLKSTSH